MKRFISAILLALAALAYGEPLKVTPGVAYRLSFEAEGELDGARWAVHMRDAEGGLPFDGALEAEWQQLLKERRAYTHLFYAPAEAVSLELLSRGPGVTLRNVKLEEWADKNLVLNGNFLEGNYSGWSECYNTELTNNQNGQPILRVNQNGYALTDYIPVRGGGRYHLKSSQGSAGAQVLVYDSLRSFIGRAERSARSPSFEVPQNAAYLRVIYLTGHHHLPSWRVNDIVGAELVPVDDSGSAGAATIVKSDEWEIVLAPGSDPREEFAARELQYWIAAITEKAPALLAQPSKAKVRKVFIGRAWAEAFAEDLKTLEGSDGYAVRNRDGDLYLFGANPRGSIYGVYALLERNTDIIWPRPNPEFAALFSKVQSLPLSDSDFLSKPVFQDRYVSGASELASRSWGGRNGLNSPWVLHKGNNYLEWQRGAQLGYSGSYMFWLSDVRGKDEKVLPLVDGKRVSSIWRQPCYTYTGTASAMAARIKMLLETLPGRQLEYLHPTIADNWTVCGCPECLAPIQLPNGEQLTTRSSDATKNPLFFSTRNFLMLNEVAETLAKEYPDLKLRTHAYIFPAEPPKVKVHPAIIPEYAAYPTQNLRYSILSGKAKGIAGIYDEGVWKRRFEQWGEEKRGALGFFGYYYPNGVNAVADTAAQDFRDLANFGGVQAHTESFPADGAELSAWDADGIEKWVIAKLMWNPSQDPEVLRKEYIRRVYRGAEKEMTEYYKIIRDAWHQAPESVFINCHTPASDIFQMLIVSPGIEERAKQLLASAESAAQGAIAKKIIQRQRAYFEKLGETMGRVPIPFVEESTKEWIEPASNHWEKAVGIQDFSKVDDWRTSKKAEAQYPSKVQLMRDKENLYFRFEGSGEATANGGDAKKGPSDGDHFEVRLKNAKNREYYLSVSPSGNSFSHPKLGDDAFKVATSADGSIWTAQMAVSLKAIGCEDPEGTSIRGRVGRLYYSPGGDREESSHNGASIFNPYESLWLNLLIK